MTKLVASLFALSMLAFAVPALAECAGHQTTTVQSGPVMTSDANGSVPMTPVPAPGTGG